MGQAEALVWTAGLSVVERQSPAQRSGIRHARACQPGEAATRAGQRHSARAFPGAWDVGGLRLCGPTPQTLGRKQVTAQAAWLCHSLGTESPFPGEAGRPPEIQAPGRKLRAACAFPGWWGGRCVGSFLVIRASAQDRTVMWAAVRPRGSRLSGRGSFCPYPRAVSVVGKLLHTGHGFTGRPIHPPL